MGLDSPVQIGRNVDGEAFHPHRLLWRLLRRNADVTNPAIHRIIHIRHPRPVEGDGFHAATFHWFSMFRTRAMISRAASLLGAASNTAKPWAADSANSTRWCTETGKTGTSNSARALATSRPIAVFAINHKCDFEVFLELLGFTHELHDLARGPDVVR